MSPTRALAIAELQCRVARLEMHAANSLAALSRAKPTDRYRRPTRGSCELATTRYARLAVSALRRLAETRKALADLGGAP